MGSRDELLDGGVVKVDAAGRRWYTSTFKSDVVAQCLRSGASVAGVAVRHGLNPNLVRRWIKCVQEQTRKLAPLIPVVLPDTVRELGPSEAVYAGIEVRIGDALIRIGSDVPQAQLEALIRAVR